MCPTLSAELFRHAGRSFPVLYTSARAGTSFLISHGRGHHKTVLAGFILNRMYHKQLLQHSGILKDRESALQFVKRNIIYNKGISFTVSAQSQTRFSIIIMMVIRGIASEASEETRHWRGIKRLLVNNELPLQCFVCSEPSDTSDGHGWMLWS